MSCARSLCCGSLKLLLALVMLLLLVIGPMLIKPLRGPSHCQGMPGPRARTVVVVL